MSEVTRIRVTIQVDDDTFSVGQDCTDALDLAQNIGEAVAMAMNAAKGAYVENYGMASYARGFFDYLEDGRWSEKLDAITRRWWALETSESFDEWMNAHISESPLPRESDRITENCGLSVRSRKILEGLGITSKTQLVEKGGGLRDWLSGQKKSSILATNEIVEWATGVKAN